MSTYSWVSPYHAKAIILLFIIGLGACTTHRPTPSEIWKEGVDKQWVTSNKHSLLWLEKKAANPTAIHVYIEGDGTPFVNRVFIAHNPTPNYPLAMDLMKQDPQLSFYLGRPCYYQSPDFYNDVEKGKSDSPCNFFYWTTARYSEEVVATMTQALTDKIAQLPETQQSLPIILIGHSGGGTLAMLIAQRALMVDGVITIAANMDTGAWTRHHMYVPPLISSINPAKLPSLRPIPQVHFAGENDKEVPPKINAKFMKKINQEFIIKKGFTHGCCWRDEWPELLQMAIQKMGLH